jgi:hypothetical protein
MKPRTLFVIGAIVLAAVSRTIPHPPNFGPITGIALFGAATLKDRKLALLTPLAALFVSDLLIEVLYQFGLTKSWGMYSGMWLNYSVTLGITLFGFLLRKSSSPLRLATVTLASSCLFFVLSNFLPWAAGIALDPEGLPYPLTAAGLLRCYTLAIPFFHWTLLGDATYVVVLFGGFALATRWVPALRETKWAPA